MRVLPLIILASVLWIGGALSAVPAGRADEEDDDNAVGQNPNQHLPLAASCDPAACKVPDCRCSSTVLDSDIPIEQTPQVCATLLVGEERCEYELVHLSVKK